MNEVKSCSEPMTRLVIARNPLFGTLLFAYRNTTIPLTDPSSFSAEEHAALFQHPEARPLSLYVLGPFVFVLPKSAAVQADRPGRLGERGEYQLLRIKVNWGVTAV
jgi:hypothetical protein